MSAARKVLLSAARRLARELVECTEETGSSMLEPKITGDREVTMETSDKARDASMEKASKALKNLVRLSDDDLTAAFAVLRKKVQEGQEIIGSDLSFMDAYSVGVEVSVYKSCIVCEFEDPEGTGVPESKVFLQACDKVVALQPSGPVVIKNQCESDEAHVMHGGDGLKDRHQVREELERQLGEQRKMRETLMAKNADNPKFMPTADPKLDAVPTEVPAETSGRLRAREESAEGAKNLQAPKRATPPEDKKHK